MKNVMETGVALYQKIKFYFGCEFFNCQCYLLFLPLLYLYSKGVKEQGTKPGNFLNQYKKNLPYFSLHFLKSNFI